MDFSILLDNVRPIGQGFLPKEKSTPLSEKASTSPLHKEMDAYRTEIQSKILNMLGSEATHDESRFICKAALIAEYLQGYLPIPFHRLSSQLLPLLLASFHTSPQHMISSISSGQRPYPRNTSMSWGV